MNFRESLKEGTQQVDFEWKSARNGGLSAFLSGLNKQARTMLAQANFKVRVSALRFPSPSKCVWTSSNPASFCKNVFLPFSLDGQNVFAFAGPWEWMTQPFCASFYAEL